MNEQWTRWILQTADSWSEISRVISLTGIDIIDTDHRRMTELTLELNGVIEVLMSGEFSVKLLHKQNRILEEFSEYTKQHFEREERLMDLLDLKDTETHKKRHKDLLDTIDDQRRQLAEGRSTAVMELRLVVMTWVVEHINSMDMATFSLAHLQKSLGRASFWYDVAALIQSTSIPPIDFEHRLLVRSALTYGTLLEKKSADLDLKTAFSDLTATAVNHFTNEEKFMLQCKIQERENHMLLHKQFLKDLENSWAWNNAPDAILFREFFFVWLLSHINGVDNKYFNPDNWALSYMENVSKWEDVNWLIQSTSIPEFDKEHRVLVEVTLMLNQCIGKYSDKGSQRGLEIFENLQTLTREHFAHEEEFMKEHNLPDVKLHMKEHRALQATVDRWVSDYRNQRLSITKQFRLGLMQWWLKHTGMTDYKTFNPEARIGIEL